MHRKLVELREKNQSSHSEGPGTVGFTLTYSGGVLAEAKMIKLSCHLNTVPDGGPGTCLQTEEGLRDPTRSKAGGGEWGFL